jgi:hypothetical protein
LLVSGRVATPNEAVMVAPLGPGGTSAMQALSTRRRRERSGSGSAKIHFIASLS